MEAVIFGDGFLDRNKLTELIGGRKYIVIIDEKVLELYRGIFSNFNLFKIPSGEGAKTLEVYERMVSACNVSYLGRGGVVLAVGGGAAMDAAGFLAATYMRGVAHIKVPTTLIAMCDAAIGGKNALNTKTAKNEIGTFCESESVVVDVAFLKTLPRRELISGMGEVVKYALGFDSRMLETLARCNIMDTSAISDIIRECISIKQRVVEQDFGDKGLRRTLNFGHTLGHAVEFAGGFEISHGEAVAIGCHHMAVWAHRDGVISDEDMDLVDMCYENLGLRQTFDDKYDKNIIFSHILNDKKMRGEYIDLVKMSGLGSLVVEPIKLDALYDELFKGPQPRLSLEEQWRRGVRLQGRIDALKHERDAGAPSGAGASVDISGATAAIGDFAVIELPASKSYAHRYLILAAFAETPTVIERFDISDDLGHTIEALKLLSGARFDFRENSLVVVPAPVQSRKHFRIDVDCGSSASTARFLIPFSHVRVNGATYFYGSESLENRPMHSIVNILKAQNLLADPANISGLPLCVLGKLNPGVFRIGGDTSSQFLSGLLMAAPLLGGKSRIVVSGEQVSRPYVDITLNAMRDMGVGVAVSRKNGDIYDISPASYNSKGTIRIERDYSQAAFWLVAELLRQIRGGADFKKILLPGLSADSLQGDRIILDILGISISENGEVVRVREPLNEVDLTHCPDLFPILAVFFALGGSGGTITGVDRVTYKESDRYSSMTHELARLGCRMAKESGKLTIYPGKLVGRSLSAHDDHRIAMALIVLGLFVGGISIDSAASISKSYPGFADDLSKVLGI